MLGWYRGVRIVPPLVTRDQSAWPYGPPDATCLCETLRQTTEERCDGRRGDLRGREATDDAVCGDQDAGAAELLDAPSHALSLHSPADRGNQCNPCPSC